MPAQSRVRPEGIVVWIHGVDDILQLDGAARRAVTAGCELGNWILEPGGLGQEQE